MAANIQLLPMPERAVLEEKWRALEARAQPTFFLSWTWIEAWLEESGAAPLLLEAESGGRTIALGLLTPHRTRRHAVVRPRQLLLHETGDPAFDRITIEHNGLLIDPETPGIEIADIFASLKQVSVPWNELVLGGVPLAYADAAREAGLDVEFDRRNNLFAVSLEALRTSGKSWLEGLSRNTRSQIQQACRHAEKFGPLRIDAAKTAAEAFTFFDEMCLLHEDRWKDTRGGGAFSVSKVQNFHRRLIERGTETGEVELLRASAGPQLLGYLYNFRRGDTVFNYQSGFLRMPHNHHRPGLVSHRLCIERALEQGLKTYDLLAGAMRYKQSIATDMGELVWVRAQRPTLGFALERAARNLKRRLAP